MAIRRYYPSKDTSIANFDPAIGSTPISASNMGASEILNLYSVVERSASANILVDFDVVTIPDPSATISLKMFNAQHAETLPVGYKVIVQDLDVDWTEGNGQDLDYYTDLGVANWVSATLLTAWRAPGAIQHDINPSSASFTFANGHEDLDVDVTNLVTGTTWPSRGYVICVDPAYENVDLYIKKFHSRHTHFPNKRPYLEVKWSDWTGSLSTKTKFMATGSGPWSGTLHDIWQTGSLGGVVVTVTSTLADPTGTLLFKMSNLKSVYNTAEVVDLRVDVTTKDWNLASVAVASPETPAAALLDAYYRVIDVASESELVPFGTGSLKHTKLSYDDKGNYFKFYMSSLPENRVMRFEFVYQISGSWTYVSSDDFKFKVR